MHANERHGLRFWFVAIFSRNIVKLIRACLVSAPPGLPLSISFPLLHCVHNADTVASSGGTKSSAALVGGVVAGVLLLVILLLVVFGRRHKSRAILTSAPEDGIYSQQMVPMGGPNGAPGEIDRRHCHIQGNLEHGLFGPIKYGLYTNSRAASGFQRIPVAVVTLRRNASDAEAREFERELAVVRAAGTHAAVLTLLGFSTTHEPHYMLFPLMDPGRLDKYLRDSRATRTMPQSISGWSF